MGFLDSNICKVSDLRKKGVIASNITAAMDGTSSTYNVDCDKYNTCFVIVNNANNSSIPFRIILKSGQIDAVVPDSAVACLNTQINSPANSLTAINNSVSYFALDVSALNYISITKGESAAITFSYILTNDTSGRSYVNLFKGDSKTKSFPLGLTNSSNYAKCNFANTTTVYITNQNAFLVRNNNDFTRWWCNELGMYVNNNTNIPAGSYTFTADTHDKDTILFSVTSFNGSAFYVMSDEVQLKHPVRISYYLNRTTAIGNGAWIRKPIGARYAIATIVSDTTTTPNVKLYAGGINTDMTKTTPDVAGGILQTTGKAVDIDTNTLSNSYAINKSVTNLLFDVTSAGFVSASIEGSITDVTIYYEFFFDEIPETYRNTLYPTEHVVIDTKDADFIEKAGFTKIFGTDSVDVYEWKNSSIPYLRCVMDNVWVWSSAASIFISADGISGEKHEVAFNATNFPNLLPDSAIERIVLLPYTRNATVAFSGNDWRMNVITTRGQVYHNKPSRSSNPDLEGTSLAGDEYKFDESVIWELPERWTPVATNTGDDATLIATGKYRYYPGLPSQCYEMHPAINQNNGYGNNGFGATLTKDDVTFGRFWNIDNSLPQANAMSFMGGYAWHEKLCMIGTYRSNTGVNTCSRICVFLTNDGGRQWFCRYEFGEVGRRYVMNSEGAVSVLRDYGSGIYRHNFSFNGTDVGSGLFSVRVRGQIVPSSDNKEPSKKFTYLEPVSVSSIKSSDAGIKITTSSAHGLVGTDIVCFTKAGSTTTDYDWIANNDCNEISAGNGVFFVATIIDTTSFYIHPAVHNPHNELTVRHIHSVDRCKDGYTISSGERYPDGGWILWMPCKEGDSFDVKYPWGNDLEFIRLNSTSTSIYRTLGTYMLNDADNSIICGIDDSLIDMGNVQMPEGRTSTFKRGSQGVYKGRLIDIDNIQLYDNLLPTPDVAYGFKVLNGVCIYLGQNWEIAVSFDYGESWTRGLIPKGLFGEHSHFTGVSLDRCISVDNLLFKLKK